MADDSILTQDHINKIVNLMAGAGLIGAGAGGVSSLVKYLKRLNKDSRSEDDDTLYVYRDPDQVKLAAADAYADPIGATGELAGKALSWGGKKLYDVAGTLGKGFVEGLQGAAADAKDLIADPTAAGLGTVGALLSALGGYALVRKAYEKYEKNKAQDELDKAQMMFLGTQGYKKASAEEGFSGSDFLGGLPVSAPLLLMLAAGVATKGYLDSQHPVEKKMPKAPRRIEVVDKPSDDVAEYDEPSETYSKTASALEFSLHMLDSVEGRQSDVRNLISAVARDGVTEFKKAASTIGFFDALDLVKGASSNESTPQARHMAITYLAHSPAFSEQLGVVAAGEIAESYPSIYKTACSLSQDNEAALCGVASVMGQAIRAERAYELGLITEDNIKSASQTKAVSATDAMEKWLNQNAGKMRPATRGDEDESTGTSGEEAGNQEQDSASKPTSMKQLVMTGKTGRTHTDSNKLDIIDNFLNPQPKKEEGERKSENDHSGFMGVPV